jgi:hypothetical protein
MSSDERNPATRLFWSGAAAFGACWGWIASTARPEGGKLAIPTSARIGCAILLVVGIALIVASALVVIGRSNLPEARVVKKRSDV